MKLEISYLAGIIDGEGSIYIAGELHSSLYLNVTNTNLELIKALHENFGGCFNIKKKRYKTKSKGMSHIVYGWTITGKGAKDLIRKCAPYLIVKQSHAMLVSQMNTEKYWIGNPIPDKERLRRLLMRLQLRALSLRKPLKEVINEYKREKGIRVDA